MFFAVDIGNSNIVIALMDSTGRIVASKRLVTDKQGTAGSFYIGIRKAFGLSEDDKKMNIDSKIIPLEDIEGAVISSVVPEVTDQISEAMELLTSKKALVVNYQTDMGIRIAMEHPDKVGIDLLVDAVAATMEYSGKVVIFDMGTATTCSVIDEGVYLGTIIIPGIGISNEALTQKASQLPKVELKAPKNLIGKNTIESMQSGIIYANAAMLDGLVKRVEDSLGAEVTVIATGGIAGLIIPHCERHMVYEPDLLLKGLWNIYDKFSNRE